ncbi:hypothetical protein GCM10008939_03560 [Deinococcus aquiradiocola]|uniref:DUF3445 domain-containing protein n=2 Tax=Deinococcus aquiradiocola TaxID=393059 RepID=A0A917UJY2_9DEIO|nr:hypothetical protein GCM10008939_03560 [Deinococcus aquiradiocola]
MFRLGVQPVDGRTETHTFAFDRQYAAFLTEKVAARAQLQRSYVLAGLRPELRAGVLRRVAEQAARDSGGVLSWDGRVLSNAALGWAGVLDVDRGTLEDLRRFRGPLSAVVGDVEPLDALDFLAMNVQEDLSVLAVDPVTGADHLAALHVLLPEKWAPLDKIGRPFTQVHAPVAGAGPLLASAPRLVQALVTRGPFVRFVWGVTPSGRLDHHPDLPPECSGPDGNEGVPADLGGVFLRVERQTLHPVPEGSGALFTIRTYLTPLRDALTAERAAALAAALGGMTPEQRQYKGLTRLGPALEGWLRKQRFAPETAGRSLSG